MTKVSAFQGEFLMMTGLPHPGKVLDFFCCPGKSLNFVLSPGKSLNFVLTPGQH